MGVAMVRSTALHETWSNECFIRIQAQTLPCKIPPSKLDEILSYEPPMQVQLLTALSKYWPKSQPKWGSN